MEKAKSVEKVSLPDGRYYADWCGYTVKLKLPDWKDKHVKVDGGVRGFMADEIVEVKDGWLYIVNE